MLLTTIRTRATWGLVVLFLVAACGSGASLSPSASVTVSATNTPATTTAPTAVPSPTALPTAAASPAPAAPPAGLSVSAWQQLASDPFSFSGSYVAAWSGTRFVVSGHPRTTSAVEPNPVQFWSSSDGQAWLLSPVASTGSPQAFAFDGSSGIAVGSDYRQIATHDCKPFCGVAPAAVWTSPDGRTWTRLPNPKALTLSGNEAGLLLYRVVHGPAGYVALAELQIRHPFALTGYDLVLRSPDGRHWHRETGPFGHKTYLSDIQVVDGRYVIAATTCKTGHGCGWGPELWTSLDGRSWTQGPALGDHRWLSLALASVPGEALLTGVERSGSGPTHPCVAWRSSDGLVWTQTAGGCPQLLQTDAWASRLVAGSFGFVASTPKPPAKLSWVGPPSPYPTGLHCAGGVEVSATGAGWTCVHQPPWMTPLPGGTVTASQHELLWIGPGALAPHALSVWAAAVGAGQ